MSICRWPGCEAEAPHLCGKHQLAMKTAYGLVYDICEEMHLDREHAVRWTAKFAPHIVENPTQNGPWNLISSLSNQFAVRVLILFGDTRRVAYKRACRLRIDGKVPTKSLIQAVIAEDQWLTTRKAAEKIGIPHRYLRHLIYEDEMPTIVKLTSTNPLVKNQVGFVKSVLPELKTAVKRVDKRRKR